MRHKLRLGPGTLFILVGLLFGLLGVACVGGSEESDLSHDAKSDRSSRLAGRNLKKKAELATTRCTESAACKGPPTNSVLDRGYNSVLNGAKARVIPAAKSLFELPWEILRHRTALSA